MHLWRTLRRLGFGERDFGLRLALAIAGFVFGPLFAVGLMRLSGDNFRLVFRIALIPAYLSIIVLTFADSDVSRFRTTSLTVDGS